MLAEMLDVRARTSHGVWRLVDLGGAAATNERSDLAIARDLCRGLAARCAIGLSGRSLEFAARDPWDAYPAAYVEAMRGLDVCFSPGTRANPLRAFAMAMSRIARTVERRTQTVGDPAAAMAELEAAYAGAWARPTELVTAWEQLLELMAVASAWLGRRHTVTWIIDESAAVPTVLAVGSTSVDLATACAALLRNADHSLFLLESRLEERRAQASSTSLPAVGDTTRVDRFEPWEPDLTPRTPMMASQVAPAVDPVPDRLSMPRRRLARGTESSPQATPLVPVLVRDDQSVGQGWLLHSLLAGVASDVVIGYQRDGALLTVGEAVAIDAPSVLHRMAVLAASRVPVEIRVDDRAVAWVSGELASSTVLDPSACERLHAALASPRLLVVMIRRDLMLSVALTAAGRAQLARAAHQFGGPEYWLSSVGHVVVNGSLVDSMVDLSLPPPPPAPTARLRSMVQQLWQRLRGR